MRPIIIYISEAEKMEAIGQPTLFDLPERARQMDIVRRMYLQDYKARFISHLPPEKTVKND